MFNNIGAKIKGLAKFIFWVLTIISVIGGFVVAIGGINAMSKDTQTGIIGILSGVAIAVVGVIMAWLQNFLLYGFCELVDSNQKILRELEHHNMPSTTNYQIKPPVQDQNNIQQ